MKGRNVGKKSKKERNKPKNDWTQYVQVYNLCLFMSKERKKKERKKRNEKVGIE